jgi:tol-pal system protein YbgF
MGGAILEVIMITQSFVQKISNPILALVLSSLLLFLFWGCGASRKNSAAQGDEINIDELLGEDTAQEPSQGESDEAEVLRLLGITPEESKAKEETPAAVTETPRQNAESEVGALQEEISQKDREISTLRSEITQKEAKISDLETKMPQKRSGVSPSGRTSEASPGFKSRYQSALNEFNARNYQQALSIFSELLLNDPNNLLSDNCQYWIGECYYGLVNYNQAITEFEKVFSFPNSNKSDDAQLKLGLCYFKLGDKQQARAEFDRLISNYPESEYVSLAQRYLSRL